MTQNQFANPFEKPEGAEGTDEANVIIPQISSEEADKIIDHFNQQFEEKVMKKLKIPPAPHVPAQTIQSIQARQSPENSVGPVMPVTDQAKPGPDLQDYLQAIKGELPNVPFADEDSQIDLHKLLTKRNNNV